MLRTERLHGSTLRPASEAGTATLALPHSRAAAPAGSRHLRGSRSPAASIQGASGAAGSPGSRG